MTNDMKGMPTYNWYSILIMKEEAKVEVTNKNTKEQKRLNDAFLSSKLQK